MARSNIDKICLGKTSYDCIEAYDIAAYKLKTEGLKLKVYKCPICGQYHLSKYTKHGKGKK